MSILLWNFQNWLQLVLYTNWNLLFFSFLWFLIVFKFLTTHIVKYKFIYFLLNLLLVTSWGFIYNLDGVFLIILQTELILLYFFTIIFVQLKANNNLFTIKFFEVVTYRNICFLLSLPIFLFLYTIQHSIINLDFTNLNYYNFTAKIITIDFFYFFYFFYYQYPAFLFLLGAIITLFSCFFIFFFKFLKSFQNLNNQNKQHYYFLRKQALIHQTNYNTQIRLFK